MALKKNKNFNKTQLKPHYQETQENRIMALALIPTNSLVKYDLKA